MAEYHKEKFYWIKLKQSLMTSGAVDFLMSQKDGANYVVLYQCLCLNTVNQNGELADRIGEIIVPYDEIKIQRETKWFTIDTIRVALNLYEKLGLIYRQEDGILKISNFEDLIGSQTISAERKMEQRKRLALGGQEVDKKVDKKVDICPLDIEIEKDIEIDKELDKENKSIDSNNITYMPIDDEQEGEFHQDETTLMFEKFWEIYPRKVSKKDAFKAFRNIKGLKKKFPLIMEDVTRRLDSEDWTKSGGQFIPYPTSYIHQERWNDEVQGDGFIDDESYFNSNNPFLAKSMRDELRRQGR